LSLRNVEDLLHERGIEVCHGTVRFWWRRFGPMFAAEIRRKPVNGMRSSRWRWHLDEVFVKVNGSSTTSGEPWTTKERCWRPLCPRPGTRKQPEVP
jgi:transposase-like protein